MRARHFVATLVAVPLAIALGSAGPAPRMSSAQTPAPAQTPVQTPAPASPERQCFSPQQVENFRTAGGNTLYLKARTGATYELNATGACNDLDGTVQLAIMPELGLSRLCSGDWATIAVPGSARPVERCRVQITKVLSAEEVAALPSRYRP